MRQFESGKSYRASNNETYTVTKCTTSFVTVINASRTVTIRRKPNSHADGFEWISLGAGRTLEAREVITETTTPAIEADQIAHSEPATAQQTQESGSVSEQQTKADRRRANEIFRKLNNEQITVGLNCYREAMKFAESYDFSYLHHVNTFDKVEAWLKEGQSENWVDCIDELARRLNVKPKHSRYSCTFEDSESENEVVERLAEKISLIGSDPRALKAEEAYKQELEDKRREAQALAVKHVSFADGELALLSNEDMLAIQQKHGHDALETVMKTIAEHNCRVFSGCATKEALIAKLKGATEQAAAWVAYYMCGKCFRGYDCTPTDSYASRFADWFMTTEYGAKIDTQPEHANRDIDTQEASATTYEAMREAYEEYYKAQWRYKNSNETETHLKGEVDEAYKKYLMLLAEYRRSGMSEREEALNYVHTRCSEADLPIAALDDVRVDTVIVLSHKCGIHAAAFQDMSSTDMVIRLLREAGINPGFRTSYENAVKARKEIRDELHEAWQTRKTMRKSLRLLGEDSKDAQILRDVYAGNTTRPANSRRIENMLREYRRICGICAEGRRYEAESNGIFLAQVQETKPALQEVKPAVASEANNPKAQPGQTSKIQVIISPKKNPYKARRRHHKPRWLTPVHLTSKSHKHSLNPKPLVEASRIASTIRIRKF